ncbi:unknown [Alistipes sp. CAG:268]|nr:unknown [Alistipes sp. CAG:268]
MALADPPLSLVPRLRRARLRGSQSHLRHRSRPEGADRRRTCPRHEDLSGLCAQPHGQGPSLVPGGRLLDGKPLPQLLHLLEGPAVGHCGREDRPDRHGRRRRLRCGAMVLDRQRCGGCGTLPFRTRLDERRSADRHGHRDDRRPRRGEHRHLGRRQIPLLRRCADGAFPHHRRHALPPDARLRVGLGLSDPHLGHLVGRRNQIRSSGQPDDPRDGQTLHAHVEQFGGQHPVRNADTLSLALLDRRLCGPQLRQGSRGRAIGRIQGRDRSSRQMGGHGHRRIPSRRREAHLPQCLQR